MTKIILLFWVITNGDITEPQEIGSFKSMEACQVAAESLTESNPKEKRTYKYNVIATCVVVPK
jgi:hypothetical protein